MENETEIITIEGIRKSSDDIFNYLKTEFSKYKFVSNPQLPRFSGGMVGYFGYDTVRLIEDIPEKNAPITDYPIANFGFYETILAFDHIRQQILIITNVFLDEGQNLRNSYEQALERIAKIREELGKPLIIHPIHGNGHANVESNFKESHFCEAVSKIKSYIRSGDIFQAVLSQQFSRTVSVPPIQIYRALRVINPSPYLYFFKRGNHSVIGSSPEALVKVENREVTVRPIAGTRPRGKTPEEDIRLANDLLADEKELAEHAMLVDLGRNDIGRVSQYGTVTISEKMAIERYSHVMHIVSEVKGTLKPDLDAIDALKACFPAGTVSGAPKVRAMEIIEELEPVRRGLYAGALGYIDFSGNLDTCITIRTMEVKNYTAYFQSGAGIVADSIPEREYQETIHKSNALRAAIAFAEGGLQP
jgi:anthranilate synthase component 1